MSRRQTHHGAVSRMKSDTKNGSDSLLKHSNVATRLPVQDLERARLFYAEKLGLEPIEERPGGLLYRCKSGSFALFISSGASSGDFTQMAFDVTDLRATVKALRARGVVFEAYDLPGLKTMEGIAEVEGNYPSKGGVGELAAWFKDSEGNLIGIGQPVQATTINPRAETPSCKTARRVAKRS